MSIPRLSSAFRNVWLGRARRLRPFRLSMLLPSANPLNSLFRIAALSGVESSVRLHIERGDDVNARDARGHTPLMIAAGRDKAAVCALLLDANADQSLTDPLGRDALAIAIEAGAKSAVALLGEARLQIVGQPDKTPEMATRAVSVDSAGAVDPLSYPPPAQRQPVELGDWDDGEDGASSFDLSGWAPEAAVLVPEDDANLRDATTSVQLAVSAFIPIDRAADWGDVNAYLPDESTPVLKTVGGERLAQLQLILLRGLREGSAPAELVAEFALWPDGEPDPDIDYALRMTLNDLGAEVDERVERQAADVDFRVWTDDEANSSEKASLAAAVEYFENRAADRSSPMRLHLAALRSQERLTGAQEVELGQAMEAALEQAMDALAAWPAGIDRVLEAAAAASRSECPLESVAMAEAEVPEPAAMYDERVPIDSGQASQDSLENDHDETPTLDTSHFFAAATKLATMARAQEPRGGLWEAARSELASMRLARPFLLGLAEHATRDPHPSGAAFRLAVETRFRSRERLALANLKLVRSIAARYYHRGMAMDDLIQEGSIGLLKSVEKFDWRRGFKFSTYATWWIRQAITRAVGNDSRLIRVPVHVHEHAMRVWAVADAFESAHGRPVRLDELCAILDMPSKRLAPVLRALEHTVSLDEPCIESLVSADFDATHAPPDPGEAVEAAELRAVLNKMLADLGKRPAQILRMRFGFDGVAPMTLDEIGQCMDVTRERIRQIEAKAMRKIKHLARISELQAWFPEEREEKPLELGADADNGGPDFADSPIYGVQQGSAK